MSLKRLSKKHIEFAEDCLRGTSATESYKRHVAKAKEKSNYKSAQANGSRLLDDPLIKEYIENREKEFKKAGIADTNEVLTKLTEILRREIPDYTVSNKGELVETPARLPDILNSAKILLSVYEKGDKQRGGIDRKDVGVIIMPEIKEEIVNS